MEAAEAMGSFDNLQLTVTEWETVKLFSNSE